MNLTNLYEQTPLTRHEEIVVSGDRVFFDGEEYTVGANGELRVVLSLKRLEQKLDQIATFLGVGA